MKGHRDDRIYGRGEMSANIKTPTSYAPSHDVPDLSSSNYKNLFVLKFLLLSCGHRGRHIQNNLIAHLQNNNVHTSIIIKISMLYPFKRDVVYESAMINVIISIIFKQTAI